jgi:predicted permease
MILLQNENLGFTTQGLLTWRIDLPEETYGDSASWVTFFGHLEDHLDSLPGVTGVGFSTSLPPNELRMTNNYNVEGDEPSPSGQHQTAEWMLASEGYFATLGIPIVGGRFFTADDRPGSASVAVVNETFARRHFPDRDAVGARFQGGNYDPDGNWLTIVGVVGDVPYESGPAGGIAPTVYTPFLQNPWRGLYTSVRTSSSDQAALVPAIRRVVSELDPRIPIRDLALMDERVRRSEAPARFRTLLFSILAVVGLVLATSGIYAVMAYSVTRRRREIAIRMALGADTATTLRSILLRGFRISMLGLGLGLIGSLTLTRSLRSVLYEVSPMDATTLVGAATLLAAVALAASLLPAVSATRTDPADVLRDE